MPHDVCIQLIEVVRNGVTWRNLTQTIKKQKKKNYSNQFFNTHLFFFLFQGLIYKNKNSEIFNWYILN